MECWENIIGIKDDCTTTVYKHLLDDYGFSLYGLAKIADDKFKTGKVLLESIIRRGWNDTFEAITIDGFDLNKILLEAEIGTPDCDQSVTGGTQTVIFKTGKKGKSSEFYVPYAYLHVKTGGNTTVSITYESPTGTETVQLFTGAVTDNSIKRIDISKWAGQQFTLSVDLSAITVCKMIKNYNTNCRCESYTITGDEGMAGLSVNVQIRCNKSIFLCKYVDIIAPVALHRILALAWNEVMTTNKFSEFQQFSKDNAPGQMVYHDSSFPITIDGELKFSPVKGQFQQKLKNLKFPRPNCPCCMQCKGGARIVTGMN